MKSPILFVFVLLSGQSVATSPQAPAAATPPPTPAAATAPTPPSQYIYEPQSRRDPFVSLINSGTDSRKPAAVNGSRPEGIAGVLVEEVAVRGIVQSRGTWVAMMAAPNGRTYTIRPGDRLMDGTVQTITAQSVVLMQDVNDPLSRQKQREVRKQLRGEVK